MRTHAPTAEAPATRPPRSGRRASLNSGKPPCVRPQPTEHRKKASAAVGSASLDGCYYEVCDEYRRLSGRVGETHAAMVEAARTATPR